MDSVTDVFSNHAFLFYLYSSIIVWFRLCSQGKPIFFYLFVDGGRGKWGERAREREEVICIEYLTVKTVFSRGACDKIILFASLLKK